MNLTDLADLVPISSIHVPDDREREDPGDVSDITESAQSNIGQIQSIAVRRRTDEERAQVNPDAPYELLAGGRRHLAFSQVGMDVLVRVYPEDLSQDDRKRVELYENVQRLDLTWAERARLTRKIVNAQTELAGGAKAGGTGPGWSERQAGEALGKSRMTIARDIELAETLDEVPELAKCKTRSEAIKTIEMLKEKLAMKELASRHEAQEDSIESRYLVGNFLQEWESLHKHGPFDLVEIDPPYAVGYRGSVSDVRAGQPGRLNVGTFQDLTPELFPDFLREALEAAVALAADDAWILCWFGYPWYGLVHDTMKVCGLNPSPTPGLWLKESHAASMAPSQVLGHGFECFLYARKGEAQIVKRGRSDVFRYARNRQRFHPTEKPTELIQELYETFCLPGSKICIPFLGSGNGLLAARAARMEAVGMDLSQEYHDAFLSKLVGGLPDAS